MKTFTIDNKTNTITAHPTAQQAESVAGTERFATAAAFTRLTANWPAARFVEIWNSLPGATAVKKFKDRTTAVSRIWKEIQSLGQEGWAAETVQQPELVPEIDTAPLVTGAQQEAALAKPVAPQTPEELPAKTRAKRAKKPPVATKKISRQGSKTEIILGLMKRPGGASLKEIMKATGWQAHSVRGFISGTLGKKMSLTVVSTKTGDGERTYSIKA